MLYPRTTGVIVTIHRKRIEMNIDGNSGTYSAVGQRHRHVLLGARWAEGDLWVRNAGGLDLT